MSKVLRAIVGLGGALLLLVLGCVFFVAWQLFVEKPKIEGKLRVAGAEAPVRIIRDVYGVPHVFAENEADAYFGLGFAQAQDRFFQMDLTRRKMHGRLGELLGPVRRDGEDVVLRSDAQARIKGWSQAAQAQTALLPAQTRQVVEAYTSGVNAALRAGAGGPEYWLLLTKPQTWRPVDTMAAALAMTDLLTGGEARDLEAMRLSKRLSARQLEEFYVGYPDWAPRSFGRGDLTPGWSAGGAGGPDDRPAPGSNAWVVSGQKSGDGKPVLANDPHLPLAAPGPFYLAHLHWPGRDLVGASIPGAPFIVIGHNGKIAWGTTTHQIDAADIEPAPLARKAFAERREMIRQRGFAGLSSTATAITVRTTEHGPVLDPTWFDLPGDGRDGLVWRSIADDPDNGLAVAMHAISSAATVEDFFAATRTWVAPPQSLVVAAVNGDIGLAVPGRFPLRDPSGGWIGEIPPEGRLEAKNPVQGWFATANNLMPPIGYAFPTPGIHTPYRMARITEVLAQAQIHGPADAEALQGDEASPFARRLKAAIEQAAPQTDAGRTAQAQLAAWDGAALKSAFEPTVFAFFLRALGPAVYGDELGEALLARHPGPRMVFLDAVFNGELGAWCDDVDTASRRETCAETAGAALDAGALALRGALGADPDSWTWGEAHQAVFRNPFLSALPVVGDAFTVRVPKGGDMSSVNVGGLSFTGGDFTTSHAAGLRMVAVLSDLNATRFQLAPGQSGLPASRHYRDLAALWGNNEGFQIRTDWEPASPPAKSAVLLLRPQR